MATQTKAQLERRVEELEAELAQGARPADVAVMSLSYEQGGILRAVAGSHLQTVDWLKATKGALAEIARQVDGLLLTAVEREVAARVQGG